MANSNNAKSNASPKNGASNGTQKKPKKRSAAAQARRTAKWAAQKEAKRAAALLKHNKKVVEKQLEEEKRQQRILNMFPNVMGLVGAQGFMPNILAARATSKTMKNALGPGSLFNNAHRSTIYPTQRTLLSHSMNMGKWNTSMSINRGHWNTAMTTLQRGVAQRVLNAVDLYGDTPLKKAFDANRLELFTALLDKGATPNFEQQTGFDPHHPTETFLHYIIKFNAPEAGIQPYIQQLIVHGVDLNKRDGAHSTPLDLALRYQRNAIASLLIQKGAKLEEPNIHGGTPVLTAIRTNNNAIFDQMVAKGIDIDKITGPRMMFPLKEATIYSNQTMLEAVLALNPKTINTEDAQGNTPLHYAVMSNALAKISLLKSAGADPKIKNKKGQSPLSLAQARVNAGNARAFNLLKE